MSKNQQRPRLGRGLSSLIRTSTEVDTPAQTGQYKAEPTPPADAQAPQAVAATAPAQSEAEGAKKSPRLVMLPVDSIAPNPYQPRRRFSDDALEELAESIRTHGLLQPVVVARRGDEKTDAIYQLIAGERRLRAAQRAGVAEMPCIVRPADRREMLELALVENIHRAELNVVERAQAYRSLMDRFGLTQQQVADRLGQSRGSIANTLRMLDLCDAVQQLLLEGSLSFGHAKVLAGLAGLGELQASLAGRTVTEGLSVRQVEELVKAAGKPAPAGEHPAEKPKAARSAYIQDVERQLTESVGTKVAIRPGRAKHAGKLVIDYYTLDDFDRIAALLGAQIES